MHEEQQGFIFQRLVGMANPRFPKIGDLFGDEAIREAALEAAGVDYRARSLASL